MEAGHDKEGFDQLLRWAQLTCAGEVASIIAHDINNAVTGVVSYVELAQMDLPSWSESGPYLDKALEQARRVSTLASHLLALSHEAPPFPSPQDLQASLEIVCGLVQRRLEKDRIAFDSRLDVEGVHILSDPSRLIQSFLSLIFIGRKVMLKSRATAHRCLNLLARRCPGASGDCAQIQIEAVGVDQTPLLLERGFTSFPDECQSADRESVLYASVAAHLCELGGTLNAQKIGERLVFLAEIPISS